jgi:hypothetical protein
LHSQGEPRIVEDLSSEIQKALSSWPLAQFRSALEAELRKEIQTTIIGVLKQHGKPKPPVSDVVEELHPNSVTLLQRYRKRAEVSHCSTTKFTALGEMHYKTISYLISPKTIKTEKDSAISTEQLEVETSFTFVPSWWMSKLVTARAVKVDIVKLSTQGWQTNIHCFNVCGSCTSDERFAEIKKVVPEDSPIFEFC